ncbi:hypothetical protein Ocin01_15461, partial [Orchesella cincta]
CTILIVILACAASALASAVPETTKVIRDLKSLTVHEKLGLLTLSTLQPKKYGAVTWKSLFSEDDLPWVDYFFVDIRSLLVQSIKVADQAPLPEVSWSYRFEICIIWFCVDDTLTLTTDNTFMAGQKRTTSVNEVTPTTFKNFFHVPVFVWHSPEFLWNVTDNTNGDQYLTRDIYLGINDLSLNTTFDYGFVEDLGIQISNLSIDFNINYFRVNIENVTSIYADGTVEYYDPIKNDYEQYLRDDWASYRGDYLPSLEFRINCVLSGSRINPERCEQESDYVTSSYYKMNVLQLFETIGLGSMDRY